ncbi:hypothetical protein [Streptomyces sp. NPDC090080]|uniref:hypothetical protein n=1 Tax=Streptomyces sp. NPDC090080 TaxID=3365939 RepID=UPI003815EB66
MAKRLNPRRITLGGHEAVALTPQEYEQLVATRRQIGGQSARVRVLALQAKQTEQLLRELETLVTEPWQGCPERSGTAPAASSVPCSDSAEPDRDAHAGCLRCALAALLRRHRPLPS